MRGAALAVVSLALLVGCQPEAAVWVRLEAPLHVPTQCDSVTIDVRVAGNPSAPVLLSERFDLSDGPGFPLTLTLVEPDAADASRTLEVTANAFLGDALSAPWATASGQITPEEDELVPLVLKMCDCPTQ